MGFVEPVRFTWTTHGDGRRKKSPVRGTRWKARYRDSDGRARLEESFPTAALALVALDADHWSEVVPGQGRLEIFFTPSAR